MKIYTRTGDKGQTGLIGGDRVAKSTLRVAAYGEVDELNAVVGAAISELESSDYLQALERIQRTLFELGAELATPPGGEASRGTPLVTAERVTGLEIAIDALSERLAPLRHFILPGGSRAGAGVHLARTVCRRAERAVVTLAAAEEVRPEILAYLNRLSDYLFMLARAVNVEDGASEPAWLGRGDSEPAGSA
jgi:cob(I)alamin adenosyltransferase